MQKSLPLVVAANRDEFYTRPSQDAHFWQNYPALLAGRDIEAGGTWLGVNKRGCFAAVTNLAGVVCSDKPVSRGGLALNFLTGTDSAETYALSLQPSRYQGFNLLLFDGDKLIHLSNGQHQAHPHDINVPGLNILAPGYYGLSNASLDSDWPKVQNGKMDLKTLLESQALTRTGQIDDVHVPLTQLLQNELPRAQGNDRAQETYRAGSCFIRGEDYGTRASTSVLIKNDGILFCEQNYSAGGIAASRTNFQLDLV